MSLEIGPRRDRATGRPTVVEASVATAAGGATLERRRPISVFANVNGHAQAEIVVANPKTYRRGG